MGKKEFEEALKLGAGVPLEAGKREKYAGLQVEALKELKDCILKMDMEIEQEMLLAMIYKNDTNLMHNRCIM